MFLTSTEECPNPWRLTTSGGDYPEEKWVMIVTFDDSVSVWQQGDEYGESAGLLQDVEIYFPCLPTDAEYVLYAFDTYADGWDGSVYTLMDPAGNVVANNGGVSPDDGDDEGFWESFETFIVPGQRVLDLNSTSETTIEG